MSKRLARRAAEEAIRQEMDMHPAEKGEHWRDDVKRAREIAATLEECDEPVTVDAVERQFRYETGHGLPDRLRREPPAWLRAVPKGGPVSGVLDVPAPGVPVVRVRDSAEGEDAGPATVSGDV